MSDELVVNAESKTEEVVESKPKLSRLEREQKKLEDAKAAINQILSRVSSFRCLDFSTAKI